MMRSPDDVGGFGPRTIPPPPVSYQGSKATLAASILDVVAPEPDAPFWDLCCGGGSVALEAIRRGTAPELVTLVDAGPWGEVWRDVGAGTFGLALLRRLLADVPRDFSLVHEHMGWLSKQPVADADRPAVFLVLQAASFGGRAIGWGCDGWRHSGWRRLWKPTATSTRRSRLLPMVPSPDTLYARVERICEALLGVRGVHADVRTTQPTAGTVYIDPPYAGTTDYPALAFDVLGFARALAVTCWISERAPITSQATQLRDRRVGGITGGHGAARSEWLSLVAGAAPPRTSLPLTSGVSAASPTESENR